jgi:hypothetical protein
VGDVFRFFIIPLFSTPVALVVCRPASTGRSSHLPPPSRAPTRSAGRSRCRGSWNLIRIYTNSTINSSPIAHPTTSGPTSRATLPHICSTPCCVPCMRGPTSREKIVFNVMFRFEKEEPISVTSRA